MKRLAYVALLIALAAPLHGQGGQPTSLSIISAYDVSSTSYTFPVLPATAQGPVSGSTSTTAGSSVTIAGVGGPFTGLGVNDELAFAVCVDGTGQACTRVIRTFTSANAITVDSVINLSVPTTATYKHITDGTGSAQGWIKVSGVKNKNFSFNITTIAAASIETKIECIGSGAYMTPNVVWPPASGAVNLCSGGTGSFTAAAKCAIYVGEPWDRCRFGIKVTTDGGTQSVSASYNGLTE